jgi:hypothetical protein
LQEGVKALFFSQLERKLYRPLRLRDNNYLLRQTHKISLSQKKKRKYYYCSVRLFASIKGGDFIASNQPN